MANLKTLPSISKPGNKLKYPMMGKRKKKKEDEKAMERATKREDSLLGKRRPAFPSTMPKKKKEEKLRMPKSSSY